MVIATVFGDADGNKPALWSATRCYINSHFYGSWVGSDPNATWEFLGLISSWYWWCCTCNFICNGRNNDDASQKKLLNDLSYLCIIQILSRGLNRKRKYLFCQWDESITQGISYYQRASLWEHAMIAIGCFVCQRSKTRVITLHAKRCMLVSSGGVFVHDKHVTLIGKLRRLS